MTVEVRDHRPTGDSPSAPGRVQRAPALQGGLDRVRGLVRREVLAILSLLFASAHSHAGTAVWQPSSGQTQIAIWPGTAPDLTAHAKPESVQSDQSVTNVSRPTMTVYAPKGHNTGVAMVVFPGGGYQVLAMDLEGTDICDWLTSRGETCVLLKYRVPDSGPTMKEGHRY